MNKNLNRFGISTFSLTFVAKITSKTMDMNSSEKNTEGNKMEQNDIKNGKPMPNKDKDEPTLGRGMVAFIVLGTIFLVAFGFIYYAQHKNDPEYTQTAIEPDSNLAETNKAKFDTVAIDTAKTNSTDKLEEQQAEKVYNSIRVKSATIAVIARLQAQQMRGATSRKLLQLRQILPLLHRRQSLMLNQSRWSNENNQNKILTTQEL